MTTAGKSSSVRVCAESIERVFHTSPTAIRMLRKVGPEEPKKYDYRFKHMTTVGEPIEPEVWRWYHSEVGKGEAANRQFLQSPRFVSRIEALATST